MTILRDCYNSLKVLSYHPIRLIVSQELDFITKKLRTKSLMYSGDHPVLNKAEEEYRDTLATNSLYLEFAPNECGIPLRPFITVAECNICRQRETYFIDKWMDRLALLKSFERGHTLESRRSGP